jgi:phosphate-selective porin OprO/OprP
MKPTQYRKTASGNAIVIAAVLFGATALHAGTIAAPVGKEALEQGVTAPVEPSLYDKIWGLGTFYRNESNPYIQEIKLKLRYQGQYHWLDSAQGESDAWEDRRFRLGLSVRFLKNFELAGDISSTNEFDPFYDKLTELYIRWKPSDAFNLTIGKAKPQFSWDQIRQDEALQTFERYQLHNQSNVDRVPGVVITGKLSNWTYEAGIYSNQVDKEFGQFDGGWSTTVGIGYDFKKLLNVDKADWRFDWLHSEIEDNDTLLNQWSEGFNTGIVLQSGRLGLTAETFVFSGNKDDAWGFFLQPTYDIILKKLQLVARYSFSDGDGADSILAQRRYEREAPDLTGGGNGDRYQAGYLGFQYFFYGDKLKILGGAEYARLDGGGNGSDYDGWTYLTGVRLSF